MTRRLTINPALIQRNAVKADHHIKYENNEGRPPMLPICTVTFVFPRSSESVTVDAARLRENSTFIDECIKRKWFDARGRQIFMLHITAADFQKYMSWVKYLRLSTTKLKLPPANLAPGSKAYFKEHEQCLAMDRLIHWWILGDAMYDDRLKCAAMELLNEYAQKEYELPLQSFEYGWVRSKDGSQLRLWIFNLLKQTMTKAILEVRGEYMPADLVAKLFVWFLEDMTSETAPASPQVGYCGESGMLMQ